LKGKAASGQIAPSHDCLVLKKRLFSKGILICAWGAAANELKPLTWSHFYLTFPRDTEKANRQQLVCSLSIFVHPTDYYD
jgi:hypothetical protein